jgi:60S ribosome subunit biogenesis protein NIP7
MNNIKLKYSFGRLSGVSKSILFYYLGEVLGVEPRKYLCGDLYYICFNNNCFIMCGAGKYDSATLLYKGPWIGVLKGKRPYLSPQIYEKIYNDIGGFRAAIIVGDQGVKSFLYGNDILKESIIKEYPPLDQPVAVIDHSDYRVIGVAYKSGNIYRNIYDLGFFLRVWG